MLRRYHRGLYFYFPDYSTVIKHTRTVGKEAGKMAFPNIVLADFISLSEVNTVEAGYPGIPRIAPVLIIGRA